MDPIHGACTACRMQTGSQQNEQGHDGEGNVKCWTGRCEQKFLG